MEKTSRQKKLNELIASRGSCSIEQLAKELGVSEMTIRRDLQVLTESGKVIRTHGGAAIGERVSFEFNFLKRANQLKSAKAAIARVAASKVEEGQSVLLDAGTTTLAIAVELKSKEDLTVVTASLPIAARLQFCSHIKVLMLGGYVQQSSPDLTGALTNANLDALCADIAFVGVDSIDRDGTVYHRSPESSRLVSKMTKTARQVYVVADHSKLDKTALCRSYRLEDCAGLITDRGANQEFIEELAKKGFQVFAG